MKKKTHIGILLFALSIMITGCGQEHNTGKANVTTQSTHTVKTNANKKKKVVNDKQWKDLTKVDPDMKYDFTPNFKGFIAEEDKAFHKEPAKDSKLIHAGYDKYYYYYLESSGMHAVLSNTIKVKGVSIERDFNHLIKLSAVIDKEESIRCERVGNGCRGAVPTERMKQAVTYTKELLNDLDVAINKNGKGKTYGYSYQAGGTKTKELEQFLNKTK